MPVAVSYPGVFLWQALPEAVTAAPVFAQNPEPFSPGPFFYHPEVFEAALDGAGAWLPEEWRWFGSNGRPRRGDCCGVFGGRHHEFARYYAGQAIRLIEHAPNAAGWARLADKIAHNVLFEQYLLAACVDYHRGRAGSPYREVDIAYVFASAEEAFDPAVAARLGYTHLIATSKHNPDIAGRLEARVARDYPAHYDRCLAYVEETARAGHAQDRRSA